VVTGLQQGTIDPLWKHPPVYLHVQLYVERPDGSKDYVERELPLYADERRKPPRWYQHAVHGEAADLAALDIGWEAQHGQLVAGQIDVPAVSESFVVGLGERITVVGYPMHLGSQSKRPLWVTGFVASEPEDQPLRFIIDCRTREGQSGSPVFVYRLPGEYASLADGTMRQLRMKQSAVHI
jgi:hypothetical protein